MSDDQITVTGVAVDRVAMYRHMASQALAQANASDDRSLRVNHLGAAMHWLGLADDMEKFAAGQRGMVRDHAVHASGRALAGNDRRQNYELRQIIDEYMRMAAKAQASASAAVSANLRADYLDVADSWHCLAEQLAGRTLQKAQSP